MSNNRNINPGCWLKIILILIVILVMKTCNWLPSWGDLFSSKEVTIDDTPIIVKEIRSLGQLITATYYDEVVVDSTVKHPFPQLPITDDRIVIIARGKVLAGYDLKLLNAADVKVSKDTVRMHLPAVKILDVIINPADYETFEEKGKWKPESVTAVKMSARRKIIEDAGRKNLIESAGVKGRAVLEDFLKGAGFGVVVFE